MVRILKWFVLMILGMMVVIVSFQNLTSIQLRFLFSTLELPLAVVLASTMVVGFFMGLVTSALWRVRSWRAKISKDK